jgi:hypothetical protein
MSEQKFITSISVKGVDYDDVEVLYETSPAEPDVNWPGGCDVYAVYYGKVDLLPEMTSREVDELVDHISTSYDPDDGYGDYLYERRKDYELEQRATAQSLAMDPDGRWK